AQVGAGRRVYLFGQQPERVGSVAERTEQVHRFIQPALISQVVHQPKTTEQKRAFLPRQAIRRDLRQVAVEQSAARAEPSGDRGGRRNHFWMIGRGDAAQRQGPPNGGGAPAPPAPPPMIWALLPLLRLEPPPKFLPPR